MRFSTLEEFVELSNCQSFSKAAKKLYISQPTLSAHIRELEQELNVVLVSREHPIRLTAAGRLFYENACKILDLYHVTITGCQEIACSSESGVLNIKAEFAHESIKVPFRQLVASFKKLHPAIEVNLVSGEYKNLLDEFTEGRINAGFISTSFDERIEEYRVVAGVETVLVKRGSLALWMRKDNPLAGNPSVTLKDINGRPYPWPIGEQYAEIRTAAEDLFEMYDLHPKFRNILADSFFEDYLYRIEEGDVFMGIACAYDEEASQLTFKTFEPNIEHRNYFVIKRDEKNPAAGLFLNYLTEHLSVFNN